MTADFSSVTMEAKRKWHIFQAQKKTKLPTQMSASSKMSFRGDGEAKTLPDEGKLKQCLASRHNLTEPLKEVPHTEKKMTNNEFSDIKKEKRSKESNTSDFPFPFSFLNYV